MGSVGPDDSLQKALEGDLVDTGNKLLTLPSSIDELLALLENAESLLAKVWQQPPMSTCTALLPTMNALITDKLLRHTDVNVQVAVAACFNELTRITAPDPPYDDDLMKVLFKLFMIAFKQLSCEPGRNYSRAVIILETMAKVRSSLMLLDIDPDGLIVEMFRVFLNNIRSNHPPDVFKYMEMIMTLVLEESDEISFELLRPLLASVKMDNKNTSTISWGLGKKVFENCATKLQCYLREAVKALKLDVGDYAEIVASICHDTSNGKNTVSKEVASTVDDGASQLDGLSKAVHEDHYAPQTNDGNGTKLDNETSLDTLKGCEQIVQSGTDTGAPRRRRGRKPNSVIRPEEGYEHTRSTGGKYSGEVSSDGCNESKKDLNLASELGSNSSQKKIDSSNEGSLRKRGLSNKKERMTNQENDLEFSSTLRRKILQTKLKKKGFDAPMRDKRAIAESSNIRVEKEEGMLSDTGTEGKHELLPQERYGRKEIMEELNQKHVRRDVADKMEEFPVSNPAKAKFLKKEKEMKSRRSRADYGEELVNVKIQVWWPMDETFYSGTVKAFDPVTKKHTILYDDNEIEILNLRKETWEFVDEQPPEKQEADRPFPAKEPVKSQEQIAKRKASSLKKLHAASSSKRSKSENRSIIKSGDRSALDLVYLNGESDDETCETSKDDRESHAGKDALETILMKKTETVKHIPGAVAKD